MSVICSQRATVNVTGFPIFWLASYLAFSLIRLLSFQDGVIAFNSSRLRALSQETRKESPSLLFPKAKVIGSTLSGSEYFRGLSPGPFWDPERWHYGCSNLVSRYSWSMGVSPLKAQILRMQDGRWNGIKDAYYFLREIIHLCKLVYFICYLIGKLLELQILGQMHLDFTWIFPYFLL